MMIEYKAESEDKMTNIEKLNELGILVEPVGSCSDKYYLMVDEKWLYSECSLKINEAESEDQE